MKNYSKIIKRKKRNGEIEEIPSEEVEVKP